MYPTEDHVYSPRAAQKWLNDREYGLEQWEKFFDRVDNDPVTGSQLVQLKEQYR
jgi:hypothetical protein